MKAAVDFEVDLRNHDANRTWYQGYADNQTISLATDGGKLRQLMLLTIVLGTGKQFPEITRVLACNNILKQIKLCMPPCGNSD